MPWQVFKRQNWCCRAPYIHSTEVATCILYVSAKSSLLLVSGIWTFSIYKIRAKVRLGLSSSLHPTENLSLHLMQLPPGKLWSVYLVHACDAVGGRVIWRVVQLVAGCSLFPVQTYGSLLSAHRTPPLELFVNRKAI